MEPITTDGSVETLVPFDAEAAFLKRLMTNEDEDNNADTQDAEELSEGDDEVKSEEDDSEEEDSEGTSETEEDDSEEEKDDEDEEQEESEPKKKTRVVLEPDADAVVKHKVDGKEVEIPVKDLTRLYGQEASLTRKSQELAEARKNVDTSVQKYATSLDILMQRAMKEWEPYSKINFLALAKDPNFTVEDISALQDQARKAYENVHFLQSEIDATVQSVSEQRQARLIEEATKGWSVLSDPTTGIEGWGESLYNEIRSYAITEGLDKTVVNELVNPSAIKLLHKAMLYDKGQKALVKTTKVAKTPKKILKGNTEPVSKKIKPKPTDDATKRLKTSGSVEDAADVFLSRMVVKE
jgi:hypothetical protein